MKLSKIAVACLALCLVSSAVPFANIGEIPSIVANAEEAPTSGTCGENVNWNFNKETGTLTISGTGEMSSGSPWSAHRESIKKVVIEEGVTSIESYAFRHCESLTSITVDDNNSNYCDVDGVVYNKEITKLVCCPAGKKSIAIPISVTNLESVSFGDCSSLTSINISDNNPNYCDVDGVVYNKEMTNLICCAGGKESVIIPDGVTNIGDIIYSRGDAFSNCSKLTTVVIPDSVKIIGANAFLYCKSLTSIDIPDSVTDIGRYAFMGCSSLASVRLSNSLYSIQERTFCDCKSLTSIDIPSSVKSIDMDAFVDTSISSFTIPETVTRFCGYAFDGKTSRTITILNPECVIDIKQGSGSGGSINVSSLPKVTVYGYENSTAQTFYSERPNNSRAQYEFRIIGQEYPENKVSGDLNGDGKLTDSDIQEFSQKLGKREALPKDCDLNGDGIVNVIDLALMKRALLNK